MKGLPRSLSRGAQNRQEIVRQMIPIDHDIVVANGSGAPGIGSVAIGALPVGDISILAVKLHHLKFTSTDAEILATFDGDFGIGTVPNADADLGDATDVNFIAATALGAATAGVSPTKTAKNMTPFALDNSADTLEINLNLMIDDASQTDAVDVHAEGLLEVVFFAL